jgi:hypothetical protein
MHPVVLTTTPPYFLIVPVPLFQEASRIYNSEDPRQWVVSPLAGNSRVLRKLILRRGNRAARWLPLHKLAEVTRKLARDGHGYGLGYKTANPDPYPENPNPNLRVYGLLTGCRQGLAEPDGSLGTLQHEI